MSSIGVEPVVSTSEAYMSQAGFPNEAIYVSDSARPELKRRAVTKKKEKEQTRKQKDQERIMKRK